MSAAKGTTTPDPDSAPPVMAESDVPRNGGLRPVPDPTVLTDRAIEKAVNALTQYIDGQLAVRDERLRGIDTATSLRFAASDAIPHEVDEKVARLADLTNEKFAGVAIQFKERDTRSERESRDNKVAVDAAFAAQKEAAAKQDEANAKAIDKSERATAETIKTNLELTRAATDALTKGLDETKGRVTVIESTKVGNTESRTGVYAIIGVIGALLGILGIVSAFMAARPV